MHIAWEANPKRIADYTSLATKSKILLCLAEQIDKSRECRHRRTNESCRIGEASNPGPGLRNEQHKQFKV
eukprot:1639145-Heterocapsa_arctica.AAC.1